MAIARPRRLLGRIAAAAWALAAAPALAAPAYSDIEPILRERCVVCHSGPAAPQGLRLDSHAALMQDGARGPVVRPGDAEGSELVRRIKGTSQPRMPLTGPPYLSDAEIGRIAAWVAAGAPAGAAAAPPPARKLPEAGEPVHYGDVAPILLQRCVKCHADQGLMGPAPEGLRLGSLEQALQGGERVAIVPGSPAASELLRRITGQSQPRMPFDGPPYLGDEEIRVVRDWILQGARDDQGRAAPIPVGAPVRLQGRLEGHWRIDGLELYLPPGARIDKRPQPGDTVELRGRVGEDGRIRVERLRRR